MARRRYPVAVLLSLVTVVLHNVKCSELTQVYALPPDSMVQQEHQNFSASTNQAIQVVKPPEILLRNTLLQKNNASQPLQLQPQTGPSPLPMQSTKNNLVPRPGSAPLKGRFPPPPRPTPLQLLGNFFRKRPSPTPTRPVQLLTPGNLFSSAMPTMHPTSSLHSPPSSLRRPPTSLRGPPPNLRGPPPRLNGPTPTLRGPPPRLNGPTPTLRGPPPNLRRPPPNIRGPPPRLNGPTPSGPPRPAPAPSKLSTSHAPLVNESSPSISPFTSGFNEVDRFLNFVPLDYENGQVSMPGFIPLPQKREANRRNGRGPPPRRNSTSAFKNIISSFHEKFARILMGPRRQQRPKPVLKQRPMNSEDQGPGQNVQNGQQVNERRYVEEGRSHQAPANERSFKEALSAVAEMLAKNQYFPMVGKRERVRTLSQQESQHLDRRRDRRRNRRRPPPRSRYPRRRRPNYRDRPPYDEEDLPPKYHRDRDPYDDDEEEEYHGKSKYRFPKNFRDDGPPHKDHGPPYNGFKGFKPWKESFGEIEEDEPYHGEPHKPRKPAWPLDSNEKGSYSSNRYKANYNSRPHHYEKYKEYPEFHPDGIVDAEGFKPVGIKPYYGGSDKVKDWNANKMKFQQVFDYEHGVVGVSHFGSPLKPVASAPSPNKDEDAKLPKIIINHHHNLPPASAGSNFVPGPGAFPAMPGAFSPNPVVSYTPPIHHFHEDFSPFGRGPRRGRGKKEYKSSEFADSFIVNDYGKPPVMNFGLPSPGFPPHPQMHPAGPPPGPGLPAGPPMGGHMVFDHFAQNMPQHFMHGKMPTPNINQGPFGAPLMPVDNHGPSGHPVSYSNMHLPRPMIPGGHYTNQISPGFSSLGHSNSVDHFGKPSQLSSFNDHFPHSSPPDHSEGGPIQSHEMPHSPPPPDSSPFPSLNDQHGGFIPPFTPVPTKEDEAGPTQGPMPPSSEESFFKSNHHPRKKVPRKFSFKMNLSSGFDIPKKLTNHPLAEPKPTPIMNYFDLGVPDREHYKKKRKPSQSQRRPSNNNDNDSDQYHRQSSLPSLNQNQNNFGSNEFNYSTLPENWREFREDPSHKKLPSLTHNQEPTPGQLGSRMQKFRTALNPKGLFNTIISRFPGGRRMDKNSKAQTKFTPYDAKSREDTVGSSNMRKRRKSTKAPASIQDIINSDSSNHNKGIVVTLSDDELNNDSEQNDHHVGGASVESPVVVGKGRAKKPKAKLKLKGHITNEMQTEVPFNDEIGDDVLLGMHDINIPLTAEIRMGKADEKKKK